MEYCIKISREDTIFYCRQNESLLQGMTRSRCKLIPRGCLNGGCGICRIQITSGTWKLSGPISRAQVPEKYEAEGYTLACRTLPTSDLVVQVAGKNQIKQGLTGE